MLVKFYYLDQRFNPRLYISRQFWVTFSTSLHYTSLYPNDREESAEWCFFFAENSMSNTDLEDQI